MLLSCHADQMERIMSPKMRMDLGLESSIAGSDVQNQLHVHGPKDVSVVNKCHWKYLRNSVRNWSGMSKQALLGADDDWSTNPLSGRREIREMRRWVLSTCGSYSRL